MILGQKDWVMIIVFSYSLYFFKPKSSDLMDTMINIPGNTITMTNKTANQWNKGIII